MSYKTTRNWENANKMVFEGYGEYEIPEIAPVYDVPDSWISFNYARTAKDHSVGVMQNKEYRRRFMQGYNEMLARLQPSKILFYGSVPDDAGGNVIRVKSFTETMRERG